MAGYDPEGMNLLQSATLFPDKMRRMPAESNKTSQVASFCNSVASCTMIYLTIGSAGEKFVDENVRICTSLLDIIGNKHLLPKIPSREG
jgi:hypothetical protein